MADFVLKLNPPARAEHQCPMLCHFGIFRGASFARRTEGEQFIHCLDLATARVMLAEAPKLNPQPLLGLAISQVVKKP